MDEQIQGYSKVRKLAQDGDYPGALKELEMSNLNESTKAHLKTVLESNIKYAIDKTLDELDARLKQALCWKCWRD